MSSSRQCWRASWTTSSKQQGKRKVADILVDAGVTEDLVTDVVIDLTGPVIDKAVADGYLESRIRARLEPFYAERFA